MLRLAVISRAGVHAGGSERALGLGRSSEGQRNSPMGKWCGAVATSGGVQLVSCMSLSPIKSCGDPAPALTHGPAPLHVTAELGDRHQCSGTAPLHSGVALCSLSMSYWLSRDSQAWRAARVKPAFCVQQGWSGSLDLVDSPRPARSRHASGVSRW